MQSAIDKLISQSPYRGTWETFAPRDKVLFLTRKRGSILCKDFRNPTLRDVRQYLNLSDKLRRAFENQWQGTALTTAQLNKSQIRFLLEKVLKEQGLMLISINPTEITLGIMLIGPMAAFFPFSYGIGWTPFEEEFVFGVSKFLYLKFDTPQKLCRFIEKFQPCKIEFKGQIWEHPKSSWVGQIWKESQNPGSNRPPVNEMKNDT